MTKWQVVAKSETKKDIGAGRTSVATAEVKVGDPEEFKTNAELHAATLRDMFEKMGRGDEVTIDVVPVEVS